MKRLARPVWAATMFFNGLFAGWRAMFHAATEVPTSEWLTAAAWVSAGVVALVLRPDNASRHAPPLRVIVPAAGLLLLAAWFTVVHSSGVWSALVTIWMAAWVVLNVSVLVAHAASRSERRSGRNEVRSR